VIRSNPSPSLHFTWAAQVKEAVSTRTWRAHFEQAQKHAEVSVLVQNLSGLDGGVTVILLFDSHQLLSTLLPDAQAALQKISSELQSTVERVESKERYINSTFSNLVTSKFLSRCFLSIPWCCDVLGHRDVFLRAMSLNP
jgi:ribosomal protein L11 methylase PrmA